MGPLLRYSRYLEAIVSTHPSAGAQIIAANTSIAADSLSRHLVQGSEYSMKKKSRQFAPFCVSRLFCAPRQLRLVHTSGLHETTQGENPPPTPPSIYGYLLPSPKTSTINESRRAVFLYCCCRNSSQNSKLERLLPEQVDEAKPPIRAPPPDLREPRGCKYAMIAVCDCCDTK